MPRPSDWREQFLSAYAKHGVVTRACLAAHVSRAVLYLALREEPAFAAAYEEAFEASTDELEVEAIRRAKEKSDTVMSFLLKARRPLVYRERVEHLNVDVSTWTDAQLDAFTSGTSLREVMLMAPRDVAPPARSTDGGRQDAPGAAIIVERGGTAAQAVPSDLVANTAAVPPASDPPSAT